MLREMGTFTPSLCGFVGEVIKALGNQIPFCCIRKPLQKDGFCFDVCIGYLHVYRSVMIVIQVFCKTF